MKIKFKNARDLNKILNGRTIVYKHGKLKFH